MRISKQGQTMPVIAHSVQQAAPGSQLVPTHFQHAVSSAATMVAKEFEVSACLLVQPLQQMDDSWD